MSTFLGYPVDDELRTVLQWSQVLFDNYAVVEHSVIVFLCSSFSSNRKTLRNIVVVEKAWNARKRVSFRNFFEFDEAENASLLKKAQEKCDLILSTYLNFIFIFLWNKCNITLPVYVLQSTAHEDVSPFTTWKMKGLNLKRLEQRALLATNFPTKERRLRRGILFFNISVSERTYI